MEHVRKSPFFSRRDAGFTLIEVVVVLLIFAVIVGMAAVITRGVAAAQKRSLTATRIATVEAALVQFVQQQKRLPCPANGTLPSSDNTVGLELRTAGACNPVNQLGGVVPWRTLALTELEATDGWDRRLTFRVFAGLAADSGMDMSWCDPAGTGALAAGVCNNACTSASLATCTPPSTYLNTKGLQIRNVAGTILMDPVTPSTGAAYVVISHGETGGGGYLNTGILMTSTTTDGTVESANNYANRALAAFFVDDTISDVAGAAHFDDIVLRPSILSVATKAGLGPRTH